MYLFLFKIYWRFDTQVLYTNIDKKLWNRLHGPMYYKIGVFNGHEIYT